MKKALSELVAQVQDEGLDYTECFCPSDKPVSVPNEILVDHLLESGVTIQKTGYWSLRCDTRKGYMDEVDEVFYLECSECRRQVWDISQTDALSGNWKKLVNKYPYCHCGAKMNGGFENE